MKKIFSIIFLSFLSIISLNYVGYAAAGSPCDVVEVDDESSKLGFKELQELRFMLLKIAQEGSEDLSEAVDMDEEELKKSFMTFLVSKKAYTYCSPVHDFLSKKEKDRDYNPFRLEDLGYIANFCKHAKLFSSDYTSEQKENMLMFFIVSVCLTECGINTSRLRCITTEEELGLVVKEIVAEIDFEDGIQELCTQHLELEADLENLSREIREDIDVVEEVDAATVKVKA